MNLINDWLNIILIYFSQSFSLQLTIHFPSYSAMLVIIFLISNEQAVLKMKNINEIPNVFEEADDFLGNRF